MTKNDEGIQSNVGVSLEELFRKPKKSIWNNKVLNRLRKKRNFDDKKKKSKRDPILTRSVTFVVLLFCSISTGVFLIAYYGHPQLHSANEIGDAFGVANAFFSSLALGFLIYTTFLQGKQIKHLEEEFELEKKRRRYESMPRFNCNIKWHGDEAKFSIRVKLNPATIYDIGILYREIGWEEEAPDQLNNEGFINSPPNFDPRWRAKEFDQNGLFDKENTIEVSEKFINSDKDFFVIYIRYTDIYGYAYKQIIEGKHGKVPFVLLPHSINENSLYMSFISYLKREDKDYTYSEEELWYRPLGKFKVDTV